jgi:hypothetical protein
MSPITASNFNQLRRPPASPCDQPQVVAARWVFFVLIVLFPAMVVVSLTLLESGRNDFSLALYPWGGLLLIVAFCPSPHSGMLLSPWEGAIPPRATLMHKTTRIDHHGTVNMSSALRTPPVDTRSEGLT